MGVFFFKKKGLLITENNKAEITELVMGWNVFHFNRPLFVVKHKRHQLLPGFDALLFLLLKSSLFNLCACRASKLSTQHL